MAKSVVAFRLEEFDPTYTRVLIGNAIFRGYIFTNLGTLEVITGVADFRFSKVKDLGNLTTINGNANFYDSKVESLGNLTTIGGYANFERSQVENLGNLTTIGGIANFSYSQIKSLGNLTTIEGDADFRWSQVKDLGKLKTIKGFVSFDNKELADQWKKISNKDNFKTGGQSLSKTPAPKKDRVYGSKKNKPESSKDTKSAEKIEFNEKTLETIKNKVAEHNEKNPKKKVTFASAKAVVRRGMGAYSSTHRPTISGGKPNSRVAWGLARLNAFFYKIINGKSKSGKYSQDNDLIEELGYKVQKFEIGGIFQGTPYDFNAYSTDYIGTGEGNQAFGWGLYFTDKKDIAKEYAKNENLLLQKIRNKLGIQARSIYLFIPHNIDKVEYLKNQLIELKEREKKEDKEYVDIIKERIRLYENLIDLIQQDEGKIYSVTLFKGEKETDYHLIKWENPLIVDDLVKIFEEAEKIGGIEFKNGWELDEKYGLTNERGYKITGEEMYGWLSKQLGGDKEASLFLLRAGIDGIKYKSGTLSGMKDKEGYNYVIFDADDITIENKEKFADGGLIAPNGKPSNLTPEQYKLVRSKEFISWFGDWENDPENSSKVVDENGEPLVVWRGVKANNYDYQKKGYNYFAKNKSYAKVYGDILHPFFLNIRNPLDLEFFNKISSENGLTSFNNEGLFQIGETQLNNQFENELDLLYLQNLNDVYTKFNYLFKNGDGIVGYDIGSYGQELVFVTKQPEQIKLADGTNTTFDSNNPDIRFDGGGEITLLKNKIKAPFLNKLYGQDVEPSGYYAIEKKTNMFDSDDNYETKKIKYKNPLYIDVDTDTLISWKYELSNKYKAKGKQLTEKLIKEGYDVIITKYPNGDKGEIIVLDTLKLNNPDIRFMAGGRTKKAKTDRSGNYIGDGSSHVDYFVEDMTEYPQVKISVSKSDSTESVYVRYFNEDNAESITARFSTHENNAVKFGYQLNGYIATKNEILYKLDLINRKFVPNTYLSITKRQVKKLDLPKYEESDLSIKEMYDLGEGADISMHKGKIAKGSNYLIQGNTVEKIIGDTGRFEYFVNGGNVSKKVKFDIEEDEDEDRTEISIKGIGEVILTMTYPEYEFLDDIGEDGLEELGIEEGEIIGKIEHIKIEDDFKGKGYAKLLMKKAIEIAEEKGLMPLYLNASPMGNKGLNINDLTAFYESFGFEIFLEQGNNNLMILK